MPLKNLNYTSVLEYIQIYFHGCNCSGFGGNRYNDEMMDSSSAFAQFFETNSPVLTMLGTSWCRLWSVLVEVMDCFGCSHSTTSSNRVPLRLKRLNCLQPPWSLGALLKRQVRLTSELSMVNVLSPNDLMSELWILSVRPNGLFPLQYMKTKSGQ